MKWTKASWTDALRLVAGIGLSVFILSSCSSGSDSKTGYIKFYNASPNAPEIFLTVDENLDDDDDDEIEVTYGAIEYTEVSGNNSLDTGNYYIELAWQDEESSDRSDLEIIYEDSVKITSEDIKFISLSGDITEPDVLIFDIEVIDDDDDDDDDLFNIRLLNLHDDYQSVDLYASLDNETFNEAEFLGNVNYHELTDNMKLDQDQYIFYITLPGETDVLYTSVDQDYSVVSQYVIVIRDNTGVGSADFTIDSIGTNGITELADVDSEAEFGFYNAISTDDYLPEYQGQIDIEVTLDDDGDVVIDDLEKGEFSASTITANGDYSFDVKNSADGEIYISDALLSLQENADSTIFLYGRKDAIDDDEDGVTDENEDGIVDDYEIVIKSLALTKNSSSSIYSHGIQVVNLADSDDFSRVTFYFVLNDEVIDTADNLLSVLQENSGSLTLLNNTYDIFAVATIDGTETVLDSMNLVLDENSQELYLIFEQDIDASSGFSMKLINQVVN
ncbi:DUF4397 domain-containing protein [Paraglaciecola marina]|uniref:DUF4397 domain-containing protein n=1 Tax=Paraglaciecola marina TaxID=2500157 RepID=UPI00105B21AE|nr:DUF4397 domain-containing protein [Paraglaciecola marina]